MIHSLQVEAQHAILSSRIMYLTPTDGEPQSFDPLVQLG